MSRKSIEQKFRTADLWSSFGLEPAIDDVLADPLIHLVLKRDRLTSDYVRLLLDGFALKLKHRDACRKAA